MSAVVPLPEIATEVPNALAWPGAGKELSVAHDDPLKAVTMPCLGGPPVGSPTSAVEPLLDSATEVPKVVECGRAGSTAARPTTRTRRR